VIFSRRKPSSPEFKVRDILVFRNKEKQIGVDFYEDTMGNYVYKQISEDSILYDGVEFKFHKRKTVVEEVG